VAAGGIVLPFASDVTDPKANVEMVAFAEKEFGALHLAFNNAGIGGPQGLLADIDIEGYRKVMKPISMPCFTGCTRKFPRF
jgi:NAD(P)-dependent dehydrogenase (short-subunit alcohol dehydrogenase family)